MYKGCAGRCVALISAFLSGICIYDFMNFVSIWSVNYEI